MKRLISLAMLALGLAAVAVSFAASSSSSRTTAAKSAGAQGAAPADDPLIVHEWGTFTGFVGSDGVHLPFATRPRVGLPNFVVDRLSLPVASKDVQIREMMIFVKSDMLALQRMETPVVYFYTQRPRDVDVRVDFPKGLVTEVYPPVRLIGLGENLQHSFADWGRVRLVPDPGDATRSAGAAGSRIPPVTDGNHYAEARATDSAIVQFAATPTDQHEEKFLFYRGLGNFTLPVKVTALGGDRFTLQNTGAEQIASAFLIHISDDVGAPARFSQFTNIRGRIEMSMSKDVTTGAALADAIAKALEADGLYPKEARAMVETWRSSWLMEPGTRVLYLLPRRVTDELLPLHVTPTPAETTRVMVGRVEVLTPERETDIVNRLTRADPMSDVTPADERALRDLGRFANAAMDRAIALKPEAAKTMSARMRFLQMSAEQRTVALGAPK